MSSDGSGEMEDKFIVAVSLVIENGGKVLIARRSKNKDHAPGEWEAISGRLRARESPMEGARREALEETGLQVEVVCLVDAFHFERGPMRDDAIGITYHCRAPGDHVRLSEEHDAFAWVDEREVRNYNLPEGLLGAILQVLRSSQPEYPMGQFL